MTLTNSERETHKIAEEIAKKIKDGGVICLFGDIGAGKTTFTKGLAASLGIEKFTVKSPTYTFIRKYKANKNNLFHIDLYRLQKVDELLLQEIEELTDNPSNIVVIEWADRMREHLPKKRIDITLTYRDEFSREIVYQT